MSVILILQILAAICFFLAAIEGLSDRLNYRLNLGWLGAFLLCLTLFIH